MSFKRPASYRHPSNNVRQTKQLFWDNYIEVPKVKRSEFAPLFTLHHDVEGYTNFRKEYLSDEDKTGYKTAVRLLEDYQHFLLLMRSPWFREAKAQWDEEMDALLESRALDVLGGIMQSSECKPTERIAAAREILKRSGTPIKAARSRAGRPSREEVEGQMKRALEQRDEVSADIERITRKNAR